MTEEQAIKSVGRFKRILELQSAVSYSDLKKKSPKLEFAEDEDAYYSPDEHKIHLGTFLPLRVFEPKDETDLYNAFVYLHGHEEQHSRSTSKGYEIAIDLGCRKIVEKISEEIEKGGHRFRNANEYKAYSDNVFLDHGIYLPWSVIRYFVIFLANSVEDGRIERIRCHLYKGYKPFVQYHRGLFWETNEQHHPPYERIKNDKTAWLDILLGELLSLSTCQLFSKGFLEAYEDTPLFDEVKRMIPFIRDCVASPNAKGIQVPLGKICEIFTPYLLELGKLAYKDAGRYALIINELLDKTMGQSIDAMMETSELQETQEETDDGSFSPVFSHSDLSSSIKEDPESGKDNEKSDASSGMVGEEMKEEIQKALEDARDVSEEMITEIYKDIQREQKDKERVREDDDPVLTVEMIKDICEKFEERKRGYTLITPLPNILKARGKALLEKNRRYFRSIMRSVLLHQTSGSIDSSRICDLTLGDIEVFKKDGKDRLFDGCAYILIDNSGSMRGKKRRAACEAAAVIEEGFRGLVPIKIVAFDYDDHVTHEVIKGWNEQQRLNCSYNFLVHGRSGFSNVDAKDIRIATRELLSRREAKKLLVVLSDGLPCEDPETVTQAIKRARSSGIKVIGIYFEEGRIGDDAERFKTMYQKDYICCTELEIDSYLVKEFIKFSRS